MYNENSVFGAIFVIGIFTYFFRVVFLFGVPEILKSDRMKSAMDAIPVAMLVALVIPTILFVGNSLIIFRPEVFAIVFSVPLVYKFKHSGLGLVFSVLFYLGFLMI